MDLLSSTSIIDLDAIMKGSDTPAPLPDVSWSSPAMQTSTPTGNGTGVFIDTSQQNSTLASLGNILGTALNYSLQKDAIKYQQTTQTQLAGNQANQVNSALAYQAQQSSANRTLILLAVAGVALFVVMR